MNRSVLICSAVLALSMPAGLAAQQFKGELILRPIDGVRMELMEDLFFIDAKQKVWKAPKGHRTDGASIPRALWSVAGSPFTGRYLKAAVIHDVYCELRSREWKDVHQAFYDAMIVDGVTKEQALIMYYAVYRFGPRWIVDKELSCPPMYDCAQGAGPPPRLIWLRFQSPPMLGEFEDAKRRIEAQSLDVTQIQDMADTAFYRDTNIVHITGTIEHSKAINGGKAETTRVDRTGTLKQLDDGWLFRAHLDLDRTNAEMRRRGRL
jgi:hypothetical protein